MNLVTFDVNEPLLKNSDKDLLSKKNNLYIGDWCLEQKNIFLSDEKKYKTPKKYHWDDFEKYCKDQVYLKKIYLTVLKNLSENLNLFHNTQYPIRYWEILISRWLWTYLGFLLDRWEIIKSVYKDYTIESAVVFDFDDKKFIPKNTFSFHNGVLLDNYWSHWTFSEIIKFFGESKIIQINPSNEISNRAIKHEVIGVQAGTEFNKKIQEAEKLHYFDQINFSLSGKKYFFYNFDIPIALKIKLLSANFQFVLKLGKKYLVEKINSPKSRELFYKYNSTNDKFLNFANYFLVKNFPEIFLEKYLSLEKTYEDVSWPKNPDFIFTSHAHFYDEIFKIYTAKNVLKGSKFLIAQHGGNYGIEKNLLSYYMEKRVCDRFLTWGWRDDKKTFPLFITTVHNKKSEKTLYKKKEVLMVLYEFPIRPAKLLFMRTRKLRDSYILDLTKFLKKLDKKILKNINVSYKPKFEEEVEKKSILHKFPKIKFGLEKWQSKNLTHNVSNNYCLQIETILSSGFVEAMYLNRPVILLYNDSFQKSREDLFYYIKILRDENICFLNFREAANFINKNYGNLNLWWNNHKLQKARKLFCEKYCRHSEDPIKDFQKSLIFNE